MPSTFERKMTFLPRILYPVTLAQETSGKHAFLYQEHKFHKRKIVGGKEFPEWHYLADLEDRIVRPNRKVMLRVGTIKIPAGSVSSYQRAERWDEPRFLSVHVSLMKSWLSCAPASTSPEYIYFTPKRLLLLRAGGGCWWSYRAAHPFWLYSCWRSSFWPTSAQCGTLSIYQGLILAQQLCWENC